MHQNLVMIIRNLYNGKIRFAVLVLEQSNDLTGKNSPCLPTVGLFKFDAPRFVKIKFERTCLGHNRQVVTSYPVVCSLNLAFGNFEEKGL